MNVLLISAPTVAEFTDADEINTDSVREDAMRPQLGVLTLAAILEQRGYRPKVIDLNRAYLEFADSGHRTQTVDFAHCAANMIARADPDICGFSSICSSYPLTLRIAGLVRELRPHSTILLGGPQASVVDMLTLDVFKHIDFVLRGEAEETFPLLLEQLAGSRELQKVPGLTHRSDGRAVRNGSAPIIGNLDTIPFPAYHLIAKEGEFDKASLELGRGCPFACTFCSTNDFFRRKFRLRSPEVVLGDMRKMAGAYGVRNFELLHDMFTIDRRRVVAFCEAVKASGEGFTWSCSARTDCVDEELLRQMFDGGCRGVFFGIESGSERIQKTMDKHLDPSWAKRMITAAQEIGIGTTVSLIFGFPDETWEDIGETVRIFMHSIRCPQSSPQTNILAPLAETPIHTGHRHELVLEELCSDVSHQSRNQDEADLALIREHPDIFPNFYVLPTPHLDRTCILELREFLLVAERRFRWLIAGVEQCGCEILDYFREWRSYRTQVYPQLHGLALRQYYRTLPFCDDFLSFTHTHPAGSYPLVQALLEYENACRKIDGMPVSVDPGFYPAGASAKLEWDDVPVRRAGIHTFRLSCDLQRLIDAIKQRTEPVWVYGDHYYLTEDTSNERRRVRTISRLMTRVLEACDGTRTTEEVIECIVPQIAEADEDLCIYVAAKLVEAASARGFVDIYRMDSGSMHREDGAALLRAH